MKWKVKRDPLHPLSLFSGDDIWAIVDDDENVIASGFEDEAVALSHISLLRTDMSDVNSEMA
jgi:hypothetical protein